MKNIFRNLLLTVMGWFRIKANSAVDLRYAGAEQKARNKARINVVKDQINDLSARGINFENKIKTETKNRDDLLADVRHHNAAGNEDLKAKAYVQYQNSQRRLDGLVADEDDLNKQVRELEAELITLEDDAYDAENTLNKAANRQVVGKAKSSIENMHVDLKDGSLGEAIEQSDHEGAKAEAMRRTRLANDNSDVKAYRKQTNVMSMDDILNETK